MQLQKSPIPDLDDLQVPLFEAESKKLQTQVKTNKTTVAPTIEGTSVMPRQRPKASSSTPLNLTNLPLTLSPSPTTAKKSQSPVISTTDNQFQAFQSKANVIQQTFPTNNQIFPATSQSFSPAFQTTQFFSSSQENPEKNLENLFQSSIYPDPFRDESATSPSMSKKSSYDADSQVSVTSPVSPNQSFNSSALGLNAPKQGLVESASQSLMGTTNTPPTSPSASQRGHRRNMSDTSAFNK